MKISETSRTPLPRGVSIHNFCWRMTSKKNEFGVHARGIAIASTEQTCIYLIENGLPESELADMFKNQFTVHMKDCTPPISITRTYLSNRRSFRPLSAR